MEKKVCGGISDDEGRSYGWTYWLGRLLLAGEHNSTSANPRASISLAIGHRRHIRLYDGEVLFPNRLARVHAATCLWSGGKQDLCYASPCIRSRPCYHSDATLFHITLWLLLRANLLTFFEQSVPKSLLVSLEALPIMCQ